MAKIFKIIAYSCLEKYQLDIDAIATRYSIPARGFTIADKDSLLILPQHQSMKALRTLYEQALLGYTIQVLWTKDQHFQMDIDICEDLILRNEMQEIVNLKKKAGYHIHILPYSNTKFAHSWYGQLKGIDKIYGEEIHITESYSGKDLFYAPEIQNKLLTNLNIPKGYRCKNTSELHRAYDLLKKQGVSHFLVKPVYGSSGRGIREIVDEADFELEISEPLILSEKIAVKYNSITRCESNCSVEVIDGVILYEPTTQIIAGTEWIGGIVPALENKDFLASSMLQTRIMLSFLQKIGMRGWGGFDFICGEDDKSYIIDNNLNRETGMHFPKYFLQKYAPFNKMACLRIDNHRRDLSEAWEDLKNRGLAFSKDTKTGIFPIIYLQGILTFFISIERTAIESYEKLRAYAETLHQT